MATASFQTAINYQPGNAVAGDFASNNPRSTVLAGPGGLVAGTGGLNVGTFGWVQTDGVTVLATGTTGTIGFVARQDMEALIAVYLDGSGNNIPAGMQVTLYNGGDFFCTTTTTATVGQAVFVSQTTGAIQTGTAGSPPSGYSQTAFVVASAAAANTLMKISSASV